MRELFYKTEELSIKYKCILQERMYHKNFPKWFLLEIMVAIDKWKEDLNIFKLTNALSKNTNLLDSYFRLYRGKEYEFQKKRDEETKEMAKKIKENDGIIYIEGMPNEEEDERTYRVSSDQINIL